MAIVIGAVAAGAAYFASLNASAETEPGEIRTVEKTGVVLVHKGETIGRVSEPQKVSAPASVEVNINGYIKPVDERTLAVQIARAIKWGV